MRLVLVRLVLERLLVAEDLVLQPLAGHGAVFGLKRTPSVVPVSSSRTLSLRSDCEPGRLRGQDLGSVDWIGLGSFALVCVLSLLRLDRLFWLFNFAAVALGPCLPRM